jgi:dephospho-CoA kinase|tara:strand:- start:434 stop:1150 length:717 start_codon:yes stop_codon:yes gene_type:complete
MAREKMKTFQDFIKLYEGVEDPGIFKAFFTAGGPGSGKSHVSKASGAAGTGSKMSPYGLKVIDSDPLFTKMLKDVGKTTTVADIYSDEGQAIRDRAKALIAKQEKNYMEGRLGMLIDGTGKDYNKIKNSSDKLRKIGYDTYMIFVNTSLDVALQRNEARARSLDEDEVKNMWDAVQKNMGKFQSYFGRSSFLLVDNNHAGDDIFTKIFVEIGKLIDTKPTSRAANAWIKNQHAINRRG